MKNIKGLRICLVTLFKVLQLYNGPWSQMKRWTDEDKSLCKHDTIHLCNHLAHPPAMGQFYEESQYMYYDENSVSLKVKQKHIVIMFNLITRFTEFNWYMLHRIGLNRVPLTCVRQGRNRQILNESWFNLGLNDKDQNQFF